MEIIVGFILVLFVPACILLPIIILLQDSKGEGLSSSAFGGAGGSMQSVLGGQGAATFLFQGHNLARYRIHGDGTVSNALLW